MGVTRNFFVEKCIERCWDYLANAHDAIEETWFYVGLAIWAKDKWQENHKKIVAGKMEIPIFERPVFPPGGSIEIGDSRTNVPFVTNICVKGVFQSIITGFESIVQAFNASGILPTEFVAKENDIFFQNYLENKSRAKTMKRICPGIYNWFIEMLKTEEFCYAVAYNNHVKHLTGIKTEFSLNCDSGEIEANLQSFEFKSVNHEKIDTEYWLIHEWEFIANSFDKFVSLLVEAIKNKE